MLGLSKEGDEHLAPTFHLEGTRYLPTGTFYLTFTLQLIGEFSLALSYANSPFSSPKQKSDICLRKIPSFGFLPKRITRPPPRFVSHAAIMGESPLGKKKRPRHIRDGMETPWAVEKRLVCGGVKLASSVCCDYVAFVLFSRLSQLLGLLF